ncbi:ACT domain-containing protein [Methanobacterium ferruginis]|uniref:ACT domain-containing protein n=1 Tax=Methanobacterium ferruginis TaxID=710191 RepID=UPI002573438C|nr:ACT domain-containing protein [Methanobacterium ferruginis]BDZ69242.1 amino acid-binding protein [Methanobacterium ferruginis]
MKIKQLSIFLQNKKGRMRNALDVLANAGFNIRALSIADTSDFGILRLIVPDPDKAKELLEENNFVVKMGDVVAVEMSDQPGGLSTILGMLDDSDINLDYLYAFVDEKEERAIVLLHPEDIDAGIDALKKCGATIIPSKDVYNW